MTESYLTDPDLERDPEVADLEARLAPLVEPAPPLQLRPQAANEPETTEDRIDMSPLAQPTLARPRRIGLLAATLSAAAAATLLFTMRSEAPEGAGDGKASLGASTPGHAEDATEKRPPAAPSDLDPGLRVDIWSVIDAPVTHVTVVPGWELPLPDDGQAFMDLNQLDGALTSLKGGKDARKPHHFDVPPGRYTVCAQLEEHAHPVLGYASEPSYDWAPRCHRVEFETEAEAVALAFWEPPEGWREDPKSSASDPLYQPMLDGKLVEQQGLVVIPDLIYNPYAVGIHISKAPESTPESSQGRSSIGRLGPQPVFAFRNGGNGTFASGQVQICLRLESESGYDPRVGVLSLHAEDTRYDARCKTVELTDDEASRIVVFSDDPEHPLRP